jgi:hypothetical protein
MSKPNKRRQAKQKARAESIRKRKAAPPPAPKVPREDNYLTERALRRALLLNGGVPFANEAAADAFLHKALGEDLGVDDLALDIVESDPREKAQEIAFQALAWEECDEGDHLAKVRRLAAKAIELDPLCVDAWTARLRTNESEDPVTEQEIIELLAIRSGYRSRLRGRWGDELSKAPEIALRPYQRFLGAILMEAPAAGQSDVCLEVALESWNLGPNEGTAYLAVLTWLLAGKHTDQVRDLLGKISSEEGTPAEEIELFLWWKCWLAHQQGDLEAAHALFAQALETFPESDLYLFTNAETEPDLELDPELFEDNHEVFGPLVEAIALDKDFLAFGRGLVLG